MRTSGTNLAWMIFMTGVVLAACGKLEHGSSLSSGRVNNGPGPVGDIYACEGAGRNANMKLTLRHTAAVGLEQGLLEGFGSRPISLACTKSRPGGRGGADDPHTMYTCDEWLASGRKGIHGAKIYTQGISSAVLADITLDQIYPLRPKTVATLICKKAKS